MNLLLLPIIVININLIILYNIFRGYASLPPRHKASNRPIFQKYLVFLHKIENIKISKYELIMPKENTKHFSLHSSLQILYFLMHTILIDLYKTFRFNIFNTVRRGEHIWTC